MHRIINTPLQNTFWFTALFSGFLFLISCSITEDANAQDEAESGNNISTSYGFTPGSRVLFEDDFSDTPIGDFPHRMTFRNGSMEVVNWDDQKVFQLQEGCQFEIPLPETLPDRFTLEFDIHDSKSSVDTGWTAIYFAEPAARGFYPNRPGGPPFLRFAHFHGSGLHATNSNQISGVYNSGGTGNTHPALAEDLMHVEVQVDGEAIKVYANQERIVNVPNADLGRHNAITVLCDARADPTYIDNIRVAAGGMDLYSSLESEGRVATRGILFETGSDRIQPGSAATLEEILGMLRQHADLRLRIEGHTDNVGNTSSNQELSQSRAEAVRDYLVEQGIDASRLEAIGMGEEHPVADNNTEAGREQNRRVELVRL
ncbi:OmpA family protein [Rhodohalobacter sp. 614A]|uniref:OmpA family protein n=1 Tax=Rhodohalobacter sp. 614A TaxID=2908649 RepID=UPI001F36ED00|nr:OmpA family protein [Rhodohalobacter sp. 614A]